MTTEEKIKQAAKEYAGNVVDIKGKDKFSSSFITDFDRHYEVEQAFQDGAIFGREIGMKEAFEWVSLNDKSPEVRNKPYRILVKDEHMDNVREEIESISRKEDVQYIEMNFTHFRYLNLEDREYAAKIEKAMNEYVDTYIQEDRP